jgi:hypothetical protein
MIVTNAKGLADALLTATGSVAVTVTDGADKATAVADLVWNDGDPNGTGLVDFLFDIGASVDGAIGKFEAAAGVKGDWDYDEDTGPNWWGLHGTFKGVTFTVYTHKSGSLKIGAHDRNALDLVGLKAALLTVVTS